MSVGFAVLLWLHILGAIGWLGGVMIFAMLIGPVLPTLSPASRGELAVKLLPRFSRYAEIFAVFTPIFGIALAFQMGDGTMSIFSPNTNLGLFLSIGTLLSLVAVVVVFTIVSPTVRKIVRLTQETLKSPGPPPPELTRASTRLRVSSVIGLVALLLIFTCMVAAVNL
jgi:uncharacterized membrane protein